MAEVLVEFVPDFTALDSALQKLSQSGAVDASVAAAFQKTNKEILEQQQDLNQLKRTYDQVKQAASQMGKGVEAAFEQGVTEALDEAGVSAKEFNDALNKSGQTSIKTTQSLRQELRILTQNIAQAKASGGPVDPEMIRRAGELKDAISDANAEIANAGSDTRNIDNFLGSLQAVAGVAAVAQGATALWGKENEDLQKALLKVNGAIALTTGLQQVLNAVQKEGALTKLADTIAIKGQSAAQTIYTAVTGRATAATVGFKVALAATGVGLLVIGVLALVNALTSTADEMENVNRLIDDQNDAIDRLNQNIQRTTDLELARAEASGKAESELVRIRGRALNAQIDGLDAANERLAKQRDLLSSTSEEWHTLNRAISDNLDTRADLYNQTKVLEQNLAKTLADEQKKAFEDGKKRRERALQEQIDRIRRQIVEVKKGGQEELQLRQQLVRAEANLSTFQADGAQEKIKLIRAQSLAEQEQLYKDYVARIEAVDKASRERIIAELDKYIAETNEKYNQQVQYEQSLLDARTGKVRRGLQRVADDEKKSVDDRISALSSLERYQLTAIEQQEDNVRRLLIPEEERVLLLAQLADQREQVVEETEKKITDITLAEEEKRKEARAKAFQEAIEIAGDVSDVFSSINDAISQAENNRLQEQKAQLDALIEAGALTEKQAQVRRQQLEAEEKATKQRQAVRDKQLALFNAVINGAAAVVEAAPDPFRIASTAALVAAQIAVIAARPVPKFATGKKGTYKGLGMVGEAGAELIEQNGRLWIAKQPTTIYLGSQDKVYTPSETRSILQNVNNNFESATGSKAPAIDYDKLGKVINGKDGVNINIDKDFITESVANGLGFRKYFNKRYSSK
jgi:hypothetical protein